MLEESERVGGGDSVCVCVHLLDRVAAFACLKVALCSSLLFMKFLVSLAGRGEGRSGEGRGGKGERREKEEKGRKIMEEREREEDSNSLTSLR